MKKPKTKDYLDSKIVDYVIEDYGVLLYSDKYDDFFALLPFDLFEKDVYDLPKGTFDPTEVVSIGKYNINELDSIDRYYYDEWDLSDVWEVFDKNIDKVVIDYC